jgi:hypothetical protein
MKLERKSRRRNAKETAAEKSPACKAQKYLGLILIWPLLIFSKTPALLPTEGVLFIFLKNQL